MPTARRTLPALLAVALCALRPPAQAETPAPAVPQSRAEIALSFAPVVERSAPAVVSIHSTRIRPGRPGPFANDPFFSQFFGVEPRVENALGSGVIVGADGIVVSNHHVAGDARDIRVVLADRREFSARILLSDPEADLAVLKVDADAPLPALPLGDSDALAVGDLVLAIGNPFGIGQTVSGGIVSGLSRGGGRRGAGGGALIQTDAAINPGNSGGALVDMAGRLVGINTSILTRSGGSDGIGFAIPSDLVAQYVAQARAGNAAFVRPWSGLRGQSVDPDMAAALGLDLPRGLMIAEIHPQSPFAAAGLRAGDVILTLDGHPVNRPGELEFRLATLPHGSAAELTALSGGREIAGRVAVAPAPEGPPPSRVTGAGPFAGLLLAEPSPALLDAGGLPLDADGIVVLEAAGPAARSGLRPGDILVALDGKPLPAAGDTARRLARPSGLGEVTLLRDGRRLRLRLSG